MSRRTCRGPECTRREVRSMGLCEAHRRQEATGKPLRPVRMIRRANTEAIEARSVIVADGVRDGLTVTQIAASAGVAVATLRAWCSRHRVELPGLILAPTAAEQKAAEDEAAGRFYGPASFVDVAGTVTITCPQCSYTKLWTRTYPPSRRAAALGVWRVHATHDRKRAAS